MSKKTFFIITLIVLVLATLMAILIVRLDQLTIEQPTASKPTLSNQTDWLTYHNEKFGYTIKYPPTWQLTEDTQQIQAMDQQSGFNSLNLAEVFGLERLNTANYASLYFLINRPPTLKNGDCGDLNGCVATYRQSILTNPDLIVGEIQTAELAGRPALTLAIQRPQNSWQHQEFFTLTKDQLLLIRSTAKLNSESTADPETAAILQTLTWD